MIKKLENKTKKIVAKYNKAIKKHNEYFFFVLHGNVITENGNDGYNFYEINCNDDLVEFERINKEKL